MGTPWAAFVRDTGKDAGRRRVGVRLFAVLILGVVGLGAAAPARASEVEVAIDGLDGEDPAPPVTVNWRMTGAAARPPEVPGTPTLVDRSLTQRGRRWADDRRVDFLIVSVPSSVRLAGDGFLVVPPDAPMPFGMDVDFDRLRVVYPLSLPESVREARLTVRPLAPGPFVIDVTRIAVDATAETVIARERLAHAEDTLVGRPPTDVVAEPPAAGGERPEAVRVGPSGRIEAHIFADRFVLRQAGSGALILERPGREPRLSPTERFVSYQAGTDVVVADLASRETVATLSADAINALAWVRGDSYLLVAGRGRGGFRVLSPLVDDPAAATAVDLGKPGCRGCRKSAYDARFDLANGMVVLFESRRPIRDGNPADVVSLLKPGGIAIVPPARSAPAWETPERLGVVHIRNFIKNGLDAREHARLTADSVRMLTLK